MMGEHGKRIEAPQTMDMVLGGRDRSINGHLSAEHRAGRMASATRIYTFSGGKECLHAAYVSAETILGN